MAIVDYPNDPATGCFYVLYPCPPDKRLPAVRFVAGRLYPDFIRLPLKPDPRMVFAIGSEIAVKSRFDRRGIMAALLLMDAVWKGVLEAHRPLDAAKVDRLAQDLVSRPEASLALIRSSGVIGKKGSIRDAGDFVRNVIALCHWKFALSFYKGRQKNEEFAPVKAGRHWGYSAKLMNLTCEKILPRSRGWEWTDFTGDSLKSFYNNRELFPPDKR